MLLTSFSFVVALLLLVLVHEYGHFLVARWCGVKVLRFSFGLGKVLASWRDKRGTEYAWSLVPLGGYIKMLDESEGAVPEEERHLAFNQQPLWARVAIVIAGPLFNFLFAFVALWLVLVLGIKSLAPLVSEVTPGSIAARAGLTPHQEVMALNDNPVSSWRDFQYLLMPFLGSDSTLLMTVKSQENGRQTTLKLVLSKEALDANHPDVLANLGIVPFVPTIPLTVGEVLAGSPAQTAGLHPGDKILAINGHVLADWLMLVDVVKQHPNQSVSITMTRQGVQKKLTVVLASDVQDGVRVGTLGVRSQRVNWPEHWLRLQRESPIHALRTAFVQTTALTGATFTLIGRLVLGQLPWQSISGPVGIAESAGASARNGLSYYLSFLALISISLGVLNLLPIPMLDGGHLLYFLLEWVWRRPLSDRVKSVGMGCGLVLLLSLMVVAIHNDVGRLLR